MYTLREGRRRLRARCHLDTRDSNATSAPGSTIKTCIQNVFGWRHRTAAVHNPAQTRKRQRVFASCCGGGAWNRASLSIGPWYQGKRCWTSDRETCTSTKENGVHRYVYHQSRGNFRSAVCRKTDKSMQRAIAHTSRELTGPLVHSITRPRSRISCLLPVLGAFSTTSACGAGGNCTRQYGRTVQGGSLQIWAANIQIFQSSAVCCVRCACE